MLVATTARKTVRRMTTLTHVSRMPCRHDDFDYDHSATLKDTIKTHEKELCTARSLLYLVASGKPLTPDQAKLLKTEMDKHKEHRISDLAAEVKWIDSKLSEVSKIAIECTSIIERMKETCAYLQETKAKYEKQIKKGDMHIMDRDSLGIPDFELIKVKVDGLQGGTVLGKFLR